VWCAGVGTVGVPPRCWSVARPRHPPAPARRWAAAGARGHCPAGRTQSWRPRRGSASSREHIPAYEQAAKHSVFEETPPARKACAPGRVGEGGCSRKKSRAERKTAPFPVTPHRPSSSTPGGSPLPPPPTHTHPPASWHPPATRTRCRWGACGTGTPRTRRCRRGEARRRRPEVPAAQGPRTAGRPRPAMSTTEGTAPGRRPAGAAPQGAGGARSTQAVGLVGAGAHAQTTLTARARTCVWEGASLPSFLPPRRRRAGAVGQPPPAAPDATAAFARSGQRAGVTEPRPVERGRRFVVWKGGRAHAGQCKAWLGAAGLAQDSG
jgi:hypothetical protein